MNYSSPDYEKVSLLIEDIFASYGATGCPADERGEWVYTHPCDGADRVWEPKSTFISEGLDHQCYSSYNP